MTYQEIMDAARNADASGEKADAARLVRMALDIKDQAERRRPTPEGYSVVGNDANGGTVYRDEEGGLQYVSPSYAGKLDALPDDLNSISENIKTDMRSELAANVVRDNPIAARANSFVSGGTFNWGDEAVEAVSPRAAQAMRLASQGMRENHPVQDTALQIGGNIAAVAPEALSLPAGILTLGAKSTVGKMVGGGILGSLFGSGEAAISRAGANLSGERMNGVGQAAAFGGVLGGTLGIAAEPVARGIGAAYRALAPGVAANVRKAKTGLGIKGAGLDIVADAASRDAPYAAQSIQDAGRYATVASGGPNAKKLLDWAVNRPGAGGAEARAQINTMADDAANQFNAALDDTFGPVVGPKQAQADIMTASAGARGEAYAAAYEAPIDYASDAGQDLLSIYKRVPDDVLKRAQRLMETEGNKSAQVLIDVNGNRSTLPDVRTLDYVTRALRDMGDFGVGEGKEQGRAFMSLARDMRQQLDELVPEYGVARASGADAIAKREAVDLGRNAFARKMTVEDVQMEVAGMQPGERQFMKQGVRSYIQDIMDRTKVALTDDQQNAREVVGQLKVLLSGEGQKKLAAILGDEAPAFTKMMKEVMEPMTIRASIAENSKTQVRAVAEGILTDKVVPTVAEGMAEGKGILGSVAARVGPALNDGGATAIDRRGQVAAEVGAALLKPPSALPKNTMPADLARQLSELDQVSGLLGNSLGRQLPLSLMLGLQQPRPQ